MSKYIFTKITLKDLRPGDVFTLGLHHEGKHGVDPNLIFNQGKIGVAVSDFNICICDASSRTGPEDVPSQDTTCWRFDGLVNEVKVKPQHKTIMHDD